MVHIDFVIQPDSLRYNASRGRVRTRRKYSDAYQCVKPLLGRPDTVVITGYPTSVTQHARRGDSATLRGDNTGGCVDKAVSALRGSGVDGEIVREGIAP